MRRLRLAVLVVATAALVAIPTTGFGGTGPTGAGSTGPGPTGPGSTGATTPDDPARIGTSDPATAAGWGASDADTALMLRQAAATTAADALRQQVAALPGFTSIGLDVDAVVLRWRGTPPPAVTAAIAQVSVQPSGPVVVRVLPARYSYAELSDAAQRLRSTIESGRGNGIHAVSVLSDGSGLQLSVDPATPSALPTQAAPTALVAQQVAQTVTAAGVAIPTVVVAEPRMHSLSRENDFPPWAGGATIRDRETTSGYYNTTCTIGWGVRSPSGNTYLLTAGHCGQPVDQFRDPTGEWVGRVAALDSGHDIMLIQAPAAGEIYVGGPAGTAQGIKGVAGWSYPFYGEAICHSGAATGTVCGMVIEATDDIRCDSTSSGQWKCFGPLFRARRTNGQLAGRPGDSGGPVYYAYGTRVAALGTITGGDNGALIWFPGFNWAYQDWGVTPLTRSY